MASLSVSNIASSLSSLSFSSQVSQRPNSNSFSRAQFPTKPGLHVSLSTVAAPAEEEDIRNNTRVNNTSFNHKLSSHLIDECPGSSLCLLDLYDCGGITQLSFKWLKKLFFPRLKWLGIAGSVNRDILDALAKRHPHLRVSCRGEELGNDGEDDWDAADIHHRTEAQEDELEQWILGDEGDVEMEDAIDESGDDGSEED